MTQPSVPLRARFDPKLKTYWFLGSALGFLFTVVGIPFLVPWFLGLGRWVSERRFESLECVLTERALIYKQGRWFRIEKTIPLDKVQDLAVHEGPLHRKFGLCTLIVETAGGGASLGSVAQLCGVVDALEFRDAVLAQRDRVVGLTRDEFNTSAEPAPGSPALEAAAPVMREIHASLLRIEHLLESRG